MDVPKGQNSTNSEDNLDAPPRPPQRRRHPGPAANRQPPGERTEPSQQTAEAGWPAGPSSQRPATAWSGGPASACVETATAVGAARPARGQVSSGRLDDGG